MKCTVMMLAGVLRATENTVAGECLAENCGLPSIIKMDQLKINLFVLVALLLVSCGGGGGSSAQPSPTNNAPVANAGTDQSVSKQVVVNLNGSLSNDPDGDTLSYFWTQTSGTPVTLSNTAAAQPSFTTTDTVGSLVFSLYVNDGKMDSNVDTVTVTVINNYPPVASPGAPATYNGGETVALDGTASSDPDGDTITQYYWTQISGTPVTLSNPRAAKPLFAVPDVNDTLTFGLVVSDGNAQSVASTINITCLPYSGSTVILKGNPFGESLDLPASAMDITLSGNYAYVADSTAGLKIIDIFDPVKPSLVSTYDTPGSAQRVKLFGNYAYVADHSGGVQIIDISNPAAPAFAGSYVPSGFVFDVTVSGSYAFVAGDGYPTLNGYLDIVDISNPSSPSRIGRYESYGAKSSVSVSGNYAYLASGGVAGMYVIDISNPASPSLVGNIGSLTPTDLIVQGNQVFLVDYDQGLRIIDVTNPAVPSLVGSFNTAGPWGMQAFGISIAGNYAYLAGLNGMHVINISNPAALVLEGSYKIAHLSLYRGVAVAGQYAYLADQNNRFQIIDVSQPSFSSVISSIATPGIASDVALAGQHVFVTESANGAAFNGMEIFDVSGSSAPSLTASYATPYWTPRLTLGGDYVYLPLYFGGIFVVDISNVASPSLQSVLVYDPYSNPEPSDIAVNGNFLYTIGSGGLRIIDVSGVTTPVLVGGSDKIGDVIRVAGNLAYINGLEILDVSNSANPILVGSFNAIGGVTAVAGNYAYVSGASGIQIIDVSNPSNPTAMGTYNMPDATGVVVGGNYAYVPNRFYGTKILDISNPSAPFLAGRYDVPITANSVAVDADDIYITAGENGFAIAERAPRLNMRYVQGTAGSTLGYTVGWRDTEIPANVHVRCQVTGGTCTVTGIDQVGNSASVRWSLPSTPGHYEILFTVGNWQHFVTTKDRVVVP